MVSKTNNFQSQILILLTALIPMHLLAQTADDVVCDGCVDSQDIQDNSITSSDIRKGSIRSSDIRNGSIRDRV